MTARVLLIDDDARLADMVGRYLAQAGFRIEHCADAASGLAALAARRPDLVLLDLMLPDADGLDVCRRIRQSGDPSANVPVLMLTARGETTDRVVGLEIGADDYLPKPFEPRELLARVRALLRRAHPAGAGDPPRHADAAEGTGAGASRNGSAVGAGGSGGSGDVRQVLRFGRLEIDIDARRVRVGAEERPLTGYQFDLLTALARHAGRVMSRDRLMELAKGEALEAFDRSIDVHVGKIRQAIEDDPKQPRRILTVRGAGYVFARQQDA